MVLLRSRGLAVVARFLLGCAEAASRTAGRRHDLQLFLLTLYLLRNEKIPMMALFSAASWIELSFYLSILLCVDFPPSFLPFFSSSFLLFPLFSFLFFSLNLPPISASRCCPRMVLSLALMKISARKNEKKEMTSWSFPISPPTSASERLQWFQEGIMKLFARGHVSSANL